MMAMTCKYCDEGYSVYYHDFRDGRGRARLHRTFDSDGEPDSEFCQISPGWAERHPVYVWFYAFMGIGVLAWLWIIWKAINQ
jgi:hypothetical protein